MFFLISFLTNLVTSRSSIYVEDCYKINHPKRGLALIFNQEYIEGKSRRRGTRRDADDMERMLKKLDFHVTVHHDLDYDDIMDTLNHVSVQDHKQHDCLVVVVMTHGEPNGKLWAKTYCYQEDDIFHKFTGDRCISLAGKPKLFIIQASKGDVDDVAVKIETDGGYNDVRPTLYTIPVHADFLKIYSSLEGFKSYNNPECGSWFIQTLVKKFEDHHDEYDVLSILTLVNRAVAIDYEICESKEMCNFSSTLIRQLYLKSKTLS